MITNIQSGTSIDEVADGIYRINTPVPDFSFNFNQYLIADEAPLLFHTGPRRMFPLVAEAVARVLPVAQLRYIAFSHVESDECGSLNEWLAAAPDAVPVCSQVAAIVSVTDLADRAPRPLADGETLALGSRTLRWLDTPHLPHGWESGYLFDERTHTLLCGDLFTQGGTDHPPLVETDILEPSEAFRLTMDYYAHSHNQPRLIEKLAALNPTTLACMHGSAFHGDGAQLLRALADNLQQLADK